MPVGEVSADDKLVVGLDHPDCRNDKLVGGKGSQLAEAGDCHVLLSFMCVWLKILHFSHFWQIVFRQYNN